MIREVPYTSKVVSDIVQHFIHNIGIPTIERFNRCAKLLWNMPLYSGPIPAPYPIQTTSPNASPPGSSVFTYYGRPNQAVVQDVDSDFNSDALRTQFEQVHQSIKRAEDVWANSHQPEQPLGSLFPPPITPANIRTMPRTPESTLSSDSSQYDFISPIGTPSRYKSVSSSPSISLTACGAGGSQARSAVTPKRASPENGFFPFIDANGLTEFFPAIDLVRRRVVMFNWKDELLNLGIAQDLVADLMSAMNSYSETEF